MEAVFWKRFSSQSNPIVVVGAGLVGLAAALYLKKQLAHKEIIVLEKACYSNGASIRNAGFSCFGSVGELEAMRSDYSLETIIQLVKLRYEGIQLLLDSFDAKDIDYKACGGYEINTDAQSLEHSMAFWNSQLKPIFGEEPFSIVPNTFGFRKVKEIIKTPFEGSLNPAKVLQQLIRACGLNDIEIQWNVNVQALRDNSFCIDDAWYDADKILVCTNGYSSSLLGESAPVPYRNEVYMTSPIHNLEAKLQGTFHYDEGFTYFRPIGNRLLIGGARNKLTNTQTATHENTEAAEKILFSFLKEHILPDSSFQFDYRWSGVLGFGKTAIPEIQHIYENVYAAVGLNGMGVALSSWMGRKAAETIIT